MGTPFASVGLIQGMRWDLDHIASLGLWVVGFAAFGYLAYQVIELL
jgi:hypothetical protein